MHVTPANPFLLPNLALLLASLWLTAALAARLAPRWPFAPSLGDVATTLSHPATTSHRGQPPDRLDRLGIYPGLIRLSIGLEDPDDLWADFEQALARLR